MKKEMMWKLGFLLLVVVGFAIAFQYRSKEGMEDEMDSFTGVAAFTREGCGYCEQMRPVLDELSGNPNFKEMDCTSGNEDLMEKCDVDGFPTLKVFKNGVPEDYVGQRTKEDIEAAIAEATA